MSEKSSTTFPGNNCHIKNHNKSKSKYMKINNTKRKQLIDLVFLQNFQLKEAAKKMEINYSTAKTILRIYRLEKRSEKKNFAEENALRQILDSKQTPKQTEASEDTFANCETHSLRSKIKVIRNAIDNIEDYNGKLDLFVDGYNNLLSTIFESQLIINSLLSFKNASNSFASFAIKM